MPTQDLRDQVVATNPSIHLQSQDLDHIGALHDHFPHLQQDTCPDDMYHVFNRLHANAINKPIAAPGTTTMRKCAIGNYSANDHHVILLEDARAPEPAQNNQQSPSGAGSIKPGMQRWYIEKAHVQPWNPFRGGGAAAHDSHNEK
jgi:hypothetical protein